MFIEEIFASDDQLDSRHISIRRGNTLLSERLSKYIDLTSSFT